MRNGWWIQGFFACIVLHSVLYVAHVNQILSGAHPKQVVIGTVDRVVHFVKFNLAPSVGQLAPYAESFLYPKTQRRTGSFSCVRFQYTGTGECPSNINEVVALFRTPNRTEECETKISTSLYGVPGHCVVRSDVTGDVISTMHLGCYQFTMRQFSCDLGAQYASYGWDSLQYRHEPLALPVTGWAGASDREAVDGSLPTAPRNTTSEPSVADLDELSTPEPTNHLRHGSSHDTTAHAPLKERTDGGSRGIAMVVHPGVLASAYASIRWLRHDLNCSLPIEVWFKPDEMPATHPILVALVADYSATPREIDHPLATRFFTKPYALFFSAFDNVLLLDCDNFAVRNPEFLFDEPAFLATGALFWPDYWKPDNTCFGVDAYSMLWDLTGLDFVDMFEQESGQLLVNKQASDKALHVLMFYAFRSPRILTDFGLVYGDKDLYRLAWLKAQVPFHMIDRPPGSLGRRGHQTGGGFCGKTMVQYAPDGTVLFLHRNTDKMTGCAGDTLSWEILQEFRYRDVHLANYRPASYVLGDSNCFGHSDNLVDTYTETEVGRTPLHMAESTLLVYAREGVQKQHPQGCPQDLHQNPFQETVGYRLSNFRDSRGKRKTAVQVTPSAPHEGGPSRDDFKQPE